MVDDDYQIVLAVIVAIVALVGIICLAFMFILNTDEEYVEVIENYDIIQNSFNEQNISHEDEQEIFPCVRRYVSEKTCKINNYQDECAKCIWFDGTMYWDVIPSN